MSVSHCHVLNYTPRTTKLLGGGGGGGGVYWFHSVRPSVRLSCLPCPLCNIYSSGWILSILATNDHYHERVCRTQWPLTLTYIFKVARPWLGKSCPLCSVYSFGWILSIFGRNDYYHSKVCRVLCYFQNLKISIFGKFLKFFSVDLEKKSTVLDGLFPYLAQMITIMRRCVAYNDLWPWPISSRLFGLSLENRVRSAASTILMDSLHIWYKWSLAWEGVSHVMTFDLDLYLQGLSTLTLKIVSALYRFQF